MSRYMFPDYDQVHNCKQCEECGGELDIPHDEDSADYPPRMCSSCISALEDEEPECEEQEARDADLGAYETAVDAARERANESDSKR